MFEANMFKSMTSRDAYLRRIARALETIQDHFANSQAAASHVEQNFQPAAKLVSPGSTATTLLAEPTAAPSPRVVPILDTPGSQPCDQDTRLPLNDGGWAPAPVPLTTQHAHEQQKPPPPLPLLVHQLPPPYPADQSQVGHAPTELVGQQLSGLPASEIQDRRDEYVEEPQQKKRGRPARVKTLIKKPAVKARKGAPRAAHQPHATFNSTPGNEACITQQVSAGCLPVGATAAAAGNKRTRQVTPEHHEKHQFLPQKRPHLDANAGPSADQAFPHQALEHQACHSVPLHPTSTPTSCAQMPQYTEDVRTSALPNLTSEQAAQISVLSPEELQRLIFHIQQGGAAAKHSANNFGNWHDSAWNTTAVDAGQPNSFAFSNPSRPAIPVDLGAASSAGLACRSQHEQPPRYQSGVGQQAFQSPTNNRQIYWGQRQFENRQLTPSQDPSVPSAPVTLPYHVGSASASNQHARSMSHGLSEAYVVPGSNCREPVEQLTTTMQQQPSSHIELQRGSLQNRQPPSYALCSLSTEQQLRDFTPEYQFQTSQEGVCKQSEPRDLRPSQLSGRAPHLSIKSEHLPSPSDGMGFPLQTHDNPPQVFQANQAYNVMNRPHSQLFDGQKFQSDVKSSYAGPPVTYKSSSDGKRISTGGLGIRNAPMPSNAWDLNAMQKPTIDIVRTSGLSANAAPLSSIQQDTAVQGYANGNFNPRVASNPVESATVAHAPCAVTDDLVMEKLSTMQLKYKETLVGNYRLLKGAAKNVTPVRYERFMTRLNLSYCLMTASAAQNRSKGITTEIVNGMERFLELVLSYVEKSNSVGSVPIQGGEPSSRGDHGSGAVVDANACRNTGPNGGGVGEGILEDLDQASRNQEELPPGLGKEPQSKSTGRKQARRRSAEHALRTRAACGQAPQEKKNVDGPGRSDGSDAAALAVVGPVELDCHGSSVPRHVAGDVSRAPSVVRTGTEGACDGGDGISKELFEERLDRFHAGAGAVLEDAVKLESRLQSEEKQRRNGRVGDTLASLKEGRCLGVDLDGFPRAVNVMVKKEEDGEVMAASETFVIPSCGLGDKNVLGVAKRASCGDGDDDGDDARTAATALRAAVSSECAAVMARHGNMMSTELRSSERGGVLPVVVVCELFLPEVTFPKLHVRVPRGYPWDGGCVCLFERPAVGWTGVLLEAKSGFEEAMLSSSSAAAAGVSSSSPSASGAGVGGILDAWAGAARAAVANARQASGRGRGG
jgi:hypothetical protein